MTDLTDIIVGEVGTYGDIKASDIGVEMVSSGFLRRKKALRVFGTVNSELAKRRVEKAVRDHAGPSVTVINELKVRQDLL